MALVGGLCFCTDCGNLLDRPVTAKQKTVTCDVCHTQNPNQWPITTTSVSHPDAFPSRLARKNITQLDMSIRESGTLIKRTCPGCSNPEMFYSESQTRGADEGSTIFYRCPKCGYRDKEDN